MWETVQGYWEHPYLTMIVLGAPLRVWLTAVFWWLISSVVGDVSSTSMTMR